MNKLGLATLVSTVVLPAALIGCGGRLGLDADPGTHPNGNDSSANDAGPSATSSEDDAGPPRVSQCSIKVKGAWSGAWTVASESAASASLNIDYGDSSSLASPSGTNHLALGCSFDDEGTSYSVGLDVVGVTGPGTYDGRSMSLYRTCEGNVACKSGLAAGAFEGWGGNSVCSVVVDAIAPETRGGMRAHFTCPAVHDSAYELGDHRSITISGAFDLAPAALPAKLNAGRDAGASQAVTTCTVRAKGVAFIDDAKSIDTGWVLDDGSITCSGEVNGLTYELLIPGSMPAAAPLFSLYGDAWCAARSDVDYVAPGGCVVDVLRDEGLGGAFAAKFRCDSFRVIGLAGEDAPAFTVEGAIAGIRRSPPPPR